MNFRRLLARSLPQPLLFPAVDIYARIEGLRRGVKVHRAGDKIDVTKGRATIRLSLAHRIYVADVVNNFDFYFDSVRSHGFDDRRIVDFSYAAYHDVVGYDLHPVMFPSLAEPLATTAQYMDFAELRQGMTAVDLGAYSGLTSIMFKEAVGKSGRVLAVDADDTNIECIKTNFALYAKIRRCEIELLHGAVWDNNDGLEFSSDGSMGASAASIVGGRRGSVRKIPSFTLSAIAESAALDRIDFLKCDVEGAESVVFNDTAFFSRFKPRIIVEAHLVEDTMTTAKCIADLTSLGYVCEEVTQLGMPLPLIQCRPI